MMNHSTICVKKISQELGEIISLKLMKAFLGLNSDKDDEVLISFISMAVEYAEWYMEKSLRLQDWLVNYVGYVPSRAQLFFGPVISVKKVQVMYANDEIVQLPEEDYRVDVVCDYVIIPANMGATRLDVTYQAGYQNPVLIPAQIKQGIMMHVATVYRNHYTGENNVDLAPIRELYASFRQLRVAF